MMYFVLGGWLNLDSVNQSVIFTVQCCAVCCYALYVVVVWHKPVLYQNN